MDVNPYESPQTLEEASKPQPVKQKKARYVPIVESVLVIAFIAWLVYMATRPTVFRTMP
jgi:hypothetical protein